MCEVSLLLTPFLYGIYYATAAPSAGIGFDTDKGMSLSFNPIPRFPLNLLRKMNHVKDDHHGAMGKPSGMFYSLPCPVDSITQPWNHGENFCIKGPKPLNPGSRSPLNPGNRSPFSEPPKMSPYLPDHQFSRLFGIPEGAADSILK